MTKAMKSRPTACGAALTGNFALVSKGFDKDPHFSPADISPFGT